MVDRSLYAVATIDGDLGRYGAVLLKPMTPRSGWREGETLIPGTVVPGGVVTGWPLQNRLAMRENRYVRFFVSLEEAAQAVAFAEAAHAHPQRAQVQMQTDTDARMRQARGPRRLGA